MLLPRYYFFNEFCDYEALMEKSGGKTMVFRKGEYLCKPSEMLSKGFYIKKGIAKLSILSDKGNEKLIAFYSEGSIFPLITNTQEFSLEPMLVMEALTDVQTIAISPKDMRALIAENSGFAITCIDHYCKFANLLLVRNYLSDESTSLQKVSTFLYLYLKQYPKDSGSVCISQSTIASAIGITRVQVARVLSLLRDENIVSTGQKEIKIVNVKKLKEKCICVVEEL